MITGAESTGKSTLTQGLAQYFGAPWIPETAREYVENLHRHYTYEDVEKIALLQITRLEECRLSRVPLIFADTWLIITKVWFDVVYNKIPDWMEKAIIHTPVDLFLICEPDIPWIPDPVRENGGEKRILLHHRYLEEIKKYHFNYRLIGGKDDQRLQTAIHEVKQFLEFLAQDL